MDKKLHPANQKQESSIRLFLIVIATSLFIGNLTLLIFIRKEGKTVDLVKTELINIEQDKRIVNSANEISTKYVKEIELISSVFPNEETLPVFIQSFEELLQKNTDSYSLKFNAVTPLKESEKLFLPLTFVMRTDLPRFISFLNSIEKLSYMTHINSLFAKSPDGISKTSEITVGLKVYVQNPFTSK